MNKFWYKYVYVCDCLKVMKIGLIMQNDYRDGELQQTRYWRIFLCLHFSYSLFLARGFSKLYYSSTGTPWESNYRSFQTCSLKSWHTFKRLFYWSSMSKRGQNLAETRLISNILMQFAGMHSKLIEPNSSIVDSVSKVSDSFTIPVCWRSISGEIPPRS